MSFKFPKKPKNSRDGWNAHGFFIRLIADAWENARGHACGLCGQQLTPSAWEQAQAVMDALENAPGLRQIRRDMKLFRADLHRERDSFDCGNTKLVKKARKGRTRNG